jgi:hypothetical protein
MVRTDERGQALTLEAVTAAIVLLVSIGFALQMTAVTPLSASTSSQHLENQLQKTGEGLLASTAADGSLQRAVLDYDESTGQFNGADSAVAFHRSGPPDNAFGDALNETYGDRNIAYNVVVHYQTADGGREREVMISQGDPSDHAVSASRTITLDDGDELADGTELRDAGGFYAPDTDPDGPLYNVVRVEVIAWRI